VGGACGAFGKRDVNTRFCWGNSEVRGATGRQRCRWTGVN